MEECKELFQSRSSKSLKKAVDSVKEKLYAKRDRIRDLMPRVTEEEAQQMIDMIERKVICANKCKRMFSKYAQSHERKDQGI